MGFVPSVHVNDSRLKSNVAGSTVKDAMDTAIQIVKHVLGGGGARSSGEIRARCGDGSL